MCDSDVQNGGYEACHGAESAGRWRKGVVRTMLCQIARAVGSMELVDSLKVDPFFTDPLDDQRVQPAFI